MPDTLTTLQSLGLEQKEAKVYLALLDLGETTATKLAQHTALDRTLMYQLTTKLIDKGLVSFVIRNNVRYFQAADPETLLKNMQEKENTLQQILPDLKARHASLLPEINVEVYRGLEGFRTVLKDRIKVGGDMYSFGVDESKFKEEFGTLMDQFFRQEKENNLREFILTSDKAPFTYPEKHIEYRSIPDEFFDPTATAIYNDRILILVWDPLTVVLIKNKALAESYRKHFMLLWKMAK